MGLRITARSPVHRPRVIHKPAAHAGPVRVTLKGASATAGPVRISTHRNRSGSSSSGAASAAKQTAKDTASAGGALVFGFGIFAVVAVVLWKYVLAWPHTLVVALGGSDELGWSLTIGGWIVLGLLVPLFVSAYKEQRREEAKVRAAQGATQETASATEAVVEPEPMPEPAPAVVDAPEPAQPARDEGSIGAAYARLVPTTPEQRNATLTAHQQAQVDAYRRWQQRGNR